jgi:phosphoribosylglycinamide formyltransferase-1
MIDIVVMVSGGGTNLEAILQKIESGYIDNARVKMVISNNKNAYALERARNHGIEAKCISPRDYESREEFNHSLVEELTEINPDLIVLAGFLVVIPEEMTERFKNRIINIHPSLIPSFCGTGYYGLKVHEGALKRGVKITGATVHFVDSGTDTGPIILQKAVSVADDDTPETLQKRVMVEAEWEILPEAIKLFSEGRIKVHDGLVKID